VDLADWLTILRVTNTGGAMQIQDSTATNVAAFYRALGIR
jgi:hypothetical protein